MPAMGNPRDLQPGSMISVQLLSGDFSMAADGTVTYIDGNRIYAFGHRFMDIGSTALPFARSQVIALVPSFNTAFKLSTALEWMGAIYQDRDTAISGELGRTVPLAPVTISVSRGATPVETYRLRMVNDPLLSPLLLQMAIFSSIDATERTTGAASLRISGEVDFQNAPAPLRIDNMFSADNGSAMMASAVGRDPGGLRHAERLRLAAPEKSRHSHRSLRLQEAAQYRERHRLQARSPSGRQAPAAT